MSILMIKADAQTVEEALQDTKPVLLWLADGQSIGLDMQKALQQAAENYRDRITVLTLDAGISSDLKTRFEVNKHPVLIGWHNGTEVMRRARPWPSDVAGFTEKLIQLAPADPTVEDNYPKETVVNTKPVNVSDETFEQEVLQSDLPVLVDFWAAWCGPCRMVAPILEKLAGEYAGKVKIAKVDVDANPGLSQVFRIMSIPTLMFVKEGKIVGMNAGAAPEGALRNALEQLINLQVPA